MPPRRCCHFMPTCDGAAIIICDFRQRHGTPLPPPCLPRCCCLSSLLYVYADIRLMLSMTEACDFAAQCAWRERGACRESRRRLIDGHAFAAGFISFFRHFIAGCAIDFHASALPMSCRRFFFAVFHSTYNNAAKNHASAMRDQLIFSFTPFSRCRRCRLSLRFFFCVFHLPA